MSNHGTFHGLAKLAKKAGINIGATADPAPASGEDPENDGEGEGGDPAPSPAPSPAPAPEPNPAPTGDPDPDPEADPAPVEANVRSADYRAGVTATNGRWAAVFASPSARANIELATDLLAENPNMSAASIVGMCDRHGGKTADTKPTPLETLNNTPKVNLGGGGGGGADLSQASEGSAVRKKAADRVNARLGGKGVKARAARAAKQEG